MMLFLLMTLAPLLVEAGRFEVLYSWSEVDFTFPSIAMRDVYIASQQFIPNHNLIIDVDVWEGDIGRKVFVTMPKLKQGEPVTLATVTNLRRNGTTLLQPYPDWSWHMGDCDGILSVFRVKVDQCGRLWVLDSGIYDIFGESKRICPPQILIFDLRTDTLIKRHRFPSSILDNEALLITIAVDSRTPDCSDSMAYVADVGAYKLLVYDFKTDSSWAISNNLFYPYPLQGDFHINGVDFELMDGIFALTLGPIRSNGDRTLYFHSLASVHESWVSTSVIRNQTLFADDAGAAPRSFHVFRETRDSQAASHDITGSGVIFYGLVEENAIGCWNTYLPFKKQNLEVVAKDDETLQFQSGLKVYGNHVWVLTSRFQNFMVGNVPSNEINYRINVGRVADLVKNTRCDPRLQTSGSLVFPSFHP